MIRDPSDGSVREVPAVSSATAVRPAKPVLSTTTTGLAPAITKEQEQELARLDRSRKWLSAYRTNPERVARLMGETGE